MKHNHHDHCEHEEVAYCGHCQVVYCRGCKREWGDCKLSHYPYSYPWTYYQIPCGTSGVATLDISGDTTFTDVSAATIDAGGPLTADCTHSHA